MPPPIHSSSFHPLYIGFGRAKVFHFDEVHFINFPTTDHAFRVKSKNYLHSTKSQRFSPVLYFFHKGLTLLHLSICLILSKLL